MHFYIRPQDVLPGHDGNRSLRPYSFIRPKHCAVGLARFAQRRSDLLSPARVRSAALGWYSLSSAHSLWSEIFAACEQRPDESLAHC